MMITVINANGCEIDFEAATMHMDDNIIDTMDFDYAPGSEQDFFTAYEEAHEKATGEEWFLSGSNPVW